MLVCLDVDGTLETSSGLVKTDILLKLLDQGHRIVVVSPSVAVPKTPEGAEVFERISGADRLANLKAAAAKYPSRMRVYVSDNMDFQVAIDAGFWYVHPRDFLQ